MDPASLAAVLSLRRALRHDVTVRCYDTIDSANAESRRLISESSCRTGVHLPLLVLADAQTEGRGRLGRTFFSPAGGGLYMTLTVPVNIAASLVSVTTTAAVAVAHAVEAVTGRSLSIKWVNDLLLDGKKVCGILAQALNAPCGGAVACVMIGIGINLTTVSFPPELTGIAASLDVPGCRDALAAAITDTLLDLLPRGGDIEEYRRRSCVLGKAVSYTAGDTVCSGVAVAIEDDGALIVRDADGTDHALRSGEITLRLD